MGYTKNPKYQIPMWPGSTASRLAKYTKEIMKNPEMGHKNSFVGYLTWLAAFLRF